MSSIVFTDPDTLTVERHTDPKCLVFRWTSFAIRLDPLKRAHTLGAQACAKERIRALIAETSSTKGVLSREVLDWWQNEGVPGYLRAGVTHIYTVVPRTALSKISTDQWQAVTTGGLTMQNFESLEKAFERLRQLSPM